MACGSPKQMCGRSFVLVKKQWQGKESLVVSQQEYLFFIQYILKIEDGGGEPTPQISVTICLY